MRAWSLIDFSDKDSHCIPYVSKPEYRIQDILCKAWLLLGFDGVLHLQPLGPLTEWASVVRGGSGGAGLL
jgi:hypothetical protein